MEKTEVCAEQIERVSQMEAALVRLNDAIATVEDALDTYEQMWDDYRALDKYYSGKAWWEDLEADNQGLLPEDLPRGVLSEDAAYDALGDAEALRQRLKEIALTSRVCEKHHLPD
ncbi:DUF4298 domain-containing protein [uncultured Varibaculum sp.]|uniref:DUF4298 domain-containing protein n=1 Tax=uncultured Varibaculum sp. TaxID=413896 RepID=UPI0025894D3C|nr:DUF4298 domain-containing protein [uncultured Varibaculum sp.]